MLPAISAGTAPRSTCQTGKFHGITARIGPSGRYSMRALPFSTRVDSALSMPGPWAAYHSHSCAHFSTSPRAWASGLPISRVIIRAMAAALSRMALARARISPARSDTAVRRQCAKPPAARVSAASRSASDW
ncbi:hypothetical protein D3C81_1541800 [compost metagenome]